MTLVGLRHDVDMSHEIDAHKLNKVKRQSYYCHEDKLCTFVTEAIGMAKRLHTLILNAYEIEAHSRS